MSGIFICYRREDTGGYSGRLYDHLIRHFGKGQIFMDIDAIPVGQDFDAAPAPHRDTRLFSACSKTSPVVYCKPFCLIQAC